MAVVVKRTYDVPIVVTIGSRILVVHGMVPLPDVNLTHSAIITAGHEDICTAAQM
jgi:hypothetical protein